MKDFAAVQNMFYGNSAIEDEQLFFCSYAHRDKLTDTFNFVHTENLHRVQEYHSLLGPP